MFSLFISLGIAASSFATETAYKETPKRPHPTVFVKVYEDDFENKPKYFKKAVGLDLDMKISDLISKMDEQYGFSETWLIKECVDGNNNKHLIDIDNDTLKTLYIKYLRDNKTDGIVYSKPYLLLCIIAVKNDSN